MLRVSSPEIEEYRREDVHVDPYVRQGLPSLIDFGFYRSGVCRRGTLLKENFGCKWNSPTPMWNLSALAVRTVAGRYAPKCPFRGPQSLPRTWHMSCLSFLVALRICRDLFSCNC